MFKLAKRNIITFLGALLMLISFGGITNTMQPQRVEAAIQLKGGHWANKTITYSINSGTEQTVASAWVRAANEINRYGFVTFVQTSNGLVKLGQQVARNQSELGITQTWRRGNVYSRAVSYLSVNQSLKNSEGRNYAQRQYATALHELGHVLGLNHDSNPAGLMSPTSSSQFRTLDGAVISSLTQIYGRGTTGYTARSTGAQVASTQAVTATNQNNATISQKQTNSIPATSTNQIGRPSSQSAQSNLVTEARAIEQKISNTWKQLALLFKAHRLQFANGATKHEQVLMIGVQ